MYTDITWKKRYVEYTALQAKKQNKSIFFINDHSGHIWLAIKREIKLNILPLNVK